MGHIWSDLGSFLYVERWTLYSIVDADIAEEHELTHNGLSKAVSKVMSSFVHEKHTKSTTCSLFTASELSLHRTDMDCPPL